MIRKSIVTSTFVFVLAIAAILLPVPGSQAQAQAQQGCKAFHGMVQGTLPSANQFAPTDTWGGPVFTSVAGEFLSGGLSGSDGTQYGQGAVSFLKGGVYKVCFASGPVWGGPSDCLDSFTYEVPQALVVWPAANWLGSYKATVNIVSGTHRFASASGHLEVAGPFILWTDANSPFGVSGRWNGELNGSICGVQ
jgi:hypothetical protein